MAVSTGSTQHAPVASGLRRRRRRLSEEGRKNLIALALAFAALAAIVAFAVRPAAILPVGNAALENSLESEFGDGVIFGDSDRRDPVCSRAEGDGWVCTVTRFPPSSADVSAGEERRSYRVEVGALGCWTAVEERSKAPRPVDGCISILDYFGY
jgi:hypothetical protein